MSCYFPPAKAFVAGALNPLPIFAGVLVLSLSAFPSAADGPASPETCRQIQATVLRRYAAYARHDAKGYMALYTPDYAEISRTGKIERYAALRKDVVATFSKPDAAPHKVFWCAYKIGHCNTSGNRATVEAVLTVGFPVYRPKGEQVAHYYYADGHVLDLWQRTAGVWAIAHRRQLSSRTQLLDRRRPRP